MKTPNRFSIDISIPTYWTAEQALAVFDLVDSLREIIWDHYQGKILEIVTEDRGRRVRRRFRLDPGDIPF